MTEPFLLTYRLETRLWRDFLEAHYAADPQLTWRYAWGGVCIIIGSLGLAGMIDSPLIAALLLVTGFFGVLSKPLLVLKSLRAAARHPFHGEQIGVLVAPQQLTVRSGTAQYSQPWDNFIGYRRLKPGFALYHTPQSFFFIPAAVLGADAEAALRDCLAAAGVGDLARGRAR